ncbi:hypothetical protein DFH27DRAFT_611788 [Peziza echinospora]|nr:hypothetical protein DFH27DRAFT_611788 [Peziza echinospora]
MSNRSPPSSSGLDIDIDIDIEAHPLFKKPSSLKIHSSYPGASKRLFLKKLQTYALYTSLTLSGAYILHSYAPAVIDWLTSPEGKWEAMGKFGM